MLEKITDVKKMGHYIKFSCLRKVVYSDIFHFSFFFVMLFEFGAYQISEDKGEEQIRDHRCFNKVKMSIIYGVILWNIS